VSALPRALPLALGAAVYPPALVVLLLFASQGDARRLVLAYFLGAALLTIGAGLIALEVLAGAGATAPESRSASGGVFVFVGVLLLILAAWAWRRRASSPAATDGGGQRGRLADWSQRALTSRRWAFALGLAMFLPSPLYLLAVKEISDSPDSTPSQLLAVTICAIGVLLFVEVPLLALYLRPAAVESALTRVHRWLARNGWTLVAALALIAAIYAIGKGLDQLA
jgi:uncharacterized membrane protein YidH (DUF202 family)